MLSFPVEAVVQYTNKTVTSGIVRRNVLNHDSLLMYPEDNSKPFVIGTYNPESENVYFSSNIRRVVMNDAVYENPEYILARSLGGESDLLRFSIRNLLVNNYTPDQLFEMMYNAGRR